MEVLLDVLGFAGFIGLATFMKTTGRRDESDHHDA